MSTKGPGGPDEGRRLADLRAGLDRRGVKAAERTQIYRKTGITPETQRSIESTGRGYRLPAYRQFLEDLSRQADATSTAESSASVRTYIETMSEAGDRPLAFVFRELAALLEQLPEPHRTAAVRSFVRAQQRLDNGSIDAVKTLEAAAEITVEAFAQFVRTHERPE